MHLTYIDSHIHTHPEADADSGSGHIIHTFSIYTYKHTYTHPSADADSGSDHIHTCILHTDIHTYIHTHTGADADSGSGHGGVTLQAQTPQQALQTLKETMGTMARAFKAAGSGT